MTDSSLQPDDFLLLDLAAPDDDEELSLPVAQSTHSPADTTAEIDAVMQAEKDTEIKAEAETETQAEAQAEAEAEAETNSLAVGPAVSAVTVTSAATTAPTLAQTPAQAVEDTDVDTDMPLEALTSGRPGMLLVDGLNNHNHNDEHVFLDFVHDPLSHSTPDPIASGADTVGGDDHDSRTDSRLAMTMDPQDPSLEDIDIQRPFVDLLENHSTALSALEWTTATPQLAYGSLMDMELYKPSLSLSTTAHAPSLPTSSTSHSYPISPPSQHQQQQQQKPECVSPSSLGTTPMLSTVSETASSSDFVSPDLIFQPNGIYVDTQSDSEASGTGSGPSNTSGKATKPVHPSILRPLTPEEVMVPIAVRRSNRARQPSTLAVQSSEYLMHPQGMHGPATSVPSAAGSSASASGAATVERMTRSKKVYCYCQKPDDGNVMIQCDSCRQWFHGACVDITEEVAEMMELKNEKFFCEPCDERVQAWKSTSSAGIGNSFTVYSDSRDCDLPTCLNEARATSDYCSEECAIKGIELQATEAVMNKENIPPVVYIPTPKRASTSTASSSSQPESPKVEQDPVRLTALKGLTECLLVGLELKTVGGEKQAESSEQVNKGSGNGLEKGAGTAMAAVDEEQASRLAVAIEKELYNSTASPGYAACGRDYKAKYRSLFFNLKDKNNVSLRARLVSGELEPYDLVRFSHEELANPELQIINKEMRKRSIHNSVLTVEEEPYIKKTHKGELSFVPRLSSVGGPSTVPHLDHTRSDDGSSVSSGSGGEEYSLGNNRNDDNHNSSINPTLSRDNHNSGDGNGCQINTTNTIANNSNMSDQTSDSLMECDEILADKQGERDSNLHSPTGSPTGDVLDKLLARIQTNKRSSEGTAGNTFASDKRQRRTGTADNGNEDAERSEDSYLPREPSPYSPSPSGSPAMQSTTPPDSPPPLLLEDIQRAAQINWTNHGAFHKRPVVWEGCLSMHQVAKLSAKAVQIGGREVFASQGGKESRRPAWTDVLTKDVSVDGRIGIAAVETYVAQQAQSATKEIVVLKFEAQESIPLPSDRHRVEFDKLFEYFYTKQRNGVVPQRNRHVKDMYLVPLAAKDPLPGYLRGLVDDDASIRGTVPKNCLLGVLVLNKEPSHPHSNQSQTRRAQPSSSSSQSRSATSTSGRRRQPSPGTSRPYPDTQGHHHGKRPAVPLRHSSFGDAQSSGEKALPLGDPTYASGSPNTTSAAPHTTPQSVSKPPLGISSQPVSEPAPKLEPTTGTMAGAPRKIPTLQELQGLVNQLFPGTSTAATQATGPSSTGSRHISGPGPTAAAAAVSAQLSGTNMSNFIASLPSNLGMNHLRQPPQQQSPEQHPSSAPLSQRNPYVVSPVPPVFPPGMPGLAPPPPSFVPLPPYLMAQYGLPMAPSMPSTAPVPLPPMPPLPPLPPNPQQQYFAHYFPGAQHLPSSAPPAPSHSLAASSPSANTRDLGPRDPRK